jgi:hypothetical protein
MRLDVLGTTVLGATDKYVFTDRENVKNVQKAIMSHPKYKVDDQLDLGSSGADGKIGPMTKMSVRRINGWYTPGASASDSDGEDITERTLQTLHVSPVNVPSNYNAPSTSFVAKAGSGVSPGAYGSYEEPEVKAASVLPFGLPAWQLALGFVAIVGIGGGIWLAVRK